MAKTVKQYNQMPEDDEKKMELLPSQAQMFEYAKTEMIPIAQLKIDHDYQRPRSDTKIRELVKNFRLASIGWLSVNRRENGEIYVVDGQHRLEALRIKGYLYAPCQVYEGLGKNVEAADFVGSNTGRAVPRAVDLWRARRLAGDAGVLLIDSIVAEFGLSVGYNRNRIRLPNTIAACDMLELILKQGGESLLRKVLYLVTQTWPNTGDAMRSAVLGGITTFYQQFGNEPSYSDRRFISKLSRISIKQLLGETRAWTEVTGLHEKANFARMLYREYNKKLSQENRLPDKLGVNRLDE